MASCGSRGRRPANLRASRRDWADAARPHCSDMTSRNPVRADSGALRYPAPRPQKFGIGGEREVRIVGVRVGSSNQAPLVGEFAADPNVDVALLLRRVKLGLATLNASGNHER